MFIIYTCIHHLIHKMSQGTRHRGCLPARPWGANGEPQQGLRRPGEGVPFRAHRALSLRHRSDSLSAGEVSRCQGHLCRSGWWSERDLYAGKKVAAPITKWLQLLRFESLRLQDRGAHLAEESLGEKGHANIMTPMLREIWCNVLHIWWFLMTTEFKS